MVLSLSANGSVVIKAITGSSRLRPININDMLTVEWKSVLTFEDSYQKQPPFLFLPLSRRMTTSFAMVSLQRSSVKSCTCAAKSFLLLMLKRGQLILLTLFYLLILRYP